MTVPPSTAVPASVRPPAVSPARTASLVAVGGTAMAGSAGVLDAGQALGPLVVALLVGLPHGAVDHLVVARRVTGRVGWLLGTAGYGGAAVGAFAALRWAPLPMWTAFLLVSACHFGSADRQHLTRLGPRPSLLWSLVVGSVPVAALMLRGSTALRPLAETIDPSLLVLLAPPVSTATAVGVGAAGLAAVVWEARRRRWRPVVDLLAVTTVFVAAPPLWAFGVYFGLWHAVRHVARVVTEEEPWAEVARQVGAAAALRRFVADALLPTGLVVAAGVVLLAGGSDHGPVVTAVALQVTAAVTFPHALTVAWLDRQDSGDLRI